MKCVRFLTDNYADPDRVAAEYVSSENTNYPVDNIYDIERRTKVWRSAGYWDLSSNDKTIVFRETVGVDLTATIGANEYASDTLFFAAIKTAFENAGASTYTVTRDTTTNKIKITSDGSGGGGVFQLRMSDAASSDMATLLGYDNAFNYTGALTYTADDLSIHSYEFIKWDFGIPSNPKAFCFTADRNSPLVFSENAVLKLQGNTTDSWSSPQYEETISFDNYVLHLVNEDGLHTGPLRYWRFYIEDHQNAVGYIEGGLVYLGDMSILSQGVAQFPYQVEYIDRSTTVYAESGQEFTDQRPKAENISLNYNFLTKEDAEKIDDIFQTFGTHTPFFMSFDPSAVFSSTKNRAVKYVKFDSPPQMKLFRPNLFSVDVKFREVL